MGVMCRQINEEERLITKPCQISVSLCRNSSWNLLSPGSANELRGVQAIRPVYDNVGHQPRVSVLDLHHWDLCRPSISEQGTCLVHPLQHTMRSHSPKLLPKALDDFDFAHLLALQKQLSQLLHSRGCSQAFSKERI